MNNSCQKETEADLKTFFIESGTAIV